MGYPQNTLKVAFGGALASDIWRSTLDFRVTAAGGTPSAAALNAMITAAVQPAVATFWNALKTHNVVSSTYDYLAVYYYPSGSNVAASTGLGVISSTPGTSSASILPLRTALVCTKQTGFAGRANKGRAYLPCTASYTLSNFGQTPNTGPSDFATLYAQLITSLNGADWNTTAGLTGQKAIVTSASAAAPGKDILSIKCDSLPDSQRRRTGKDVPAFTSVITV